MEHKLQIEDLYRLLAGRIPGVQGASGMFAILVPLVEVAGAWHLLFEQRADTLRGQPGEVCFPGGRLEKGESPLEAAIRETWEEVGILSKDIRVIAPMDIIQDISNRVIHPFLAYLKDGALLGLRPNPHEVKEVFLVPLDFFRQNPPYVYTSPVVLEIGADFPYEKYGYGKEGYPWRSGKMDVPVYEYAGRRIWGLTARTVRWLIERLEEGGF